MFCITFKSTTVKKGLVIFSHHYYRLNLKMKSQLKHTFILLFIMSLVSCSRSDESEQTYLYKSEKLNITELINNQTGRIARKSSDENDYIHIELETSFHIPRNLNNIQIENLVLENLIDINGTLKLFINEQDVITMEIENGQLINLTNNPVGSNSAYRFQCENPHDGHCDDDYPLRHECSYDGIQDCVQHAVYEEWTTIEAIICAVTGGLECIVVEIAACIETNCF